VALNHLFETPVIKKSHAQWNYPPTCGTNFVAGSGGDIPIYNLREMTEIFGDHSKRMVAKIDIENSEYGLLYGAGQEVLSQFEYLYIEIHSGIRSPITYVPEIENSETLINFLKFNGFEVKSDKIFEEGNLRVVKMYNNGEKKVLREKG
jgi:hypothetical protein